MNYLSATPPPVKIVLVRSQKVKEHPGAVTTYQTVFDTLGCGKKSDESVGIFLPTNSPLYLRFRKRRLCRQQNVILQNLIPTDRA
jgi:hypothetical protein